jgi:hypothetical protein
MPEGFRTDQVDGDEQQGPQGNDRGRGRGPGGGGR